MSDKLKETARVLRGGEKQRCDYYCGGRNGGNRCQLELGHSIQKGHEWRWENEPDAAPPASDAPAPKLTGQDFLEIAGRCRNTFAVFSIDWERFASEVSTYRREHETKELAKHQAPAPREDAHFERMIEIAKERLERIADAAATAAQEFIDNLDDKGILDSDLLYDKVYQATLAASPLGNTDWSPSPHIAVSHGAPAGAVSSFAETEWVEQPANPARELARELCSMVWATDHKEATALLERYASSRKQVALERAAQMVEQHNRDLMERWNEVTKEPPLEQKIRSLKGNK